MNDLDQDPDTLCTQKSHPHKDIQPCHNGDACYIWSLQGRGPSRWSIPTE